MDLLRMAAVNITTLVAARHALKSLRFGASPVSETARTRRAIGEKMRCYQKAQIEGDIDIGALCERVPR